jgi:serine/threonine protein kinase
VQEFCNGGSLRQALADGMFGVRLRQRWRPILSALEGVAAGMDYMHSKRICHGDLNPANVLLTVRCLPTSAAPAHLFRSASRSSSQRCAEAGLPCVHSSMNTSIAPALSSHRRCCAV